MPKMFPPIFILFPNFQFFPNWNFSPIFKVSSIFDFSRFSILNFVSKWGRLMTIFSLFLEVRVVSRVLSLLRVFVADFVVSSSSSSSAATASPIAEGGPRSLKEQQLSFPTLTAPPTTYQNYQKWLLGYVILISTHVLRWSSILMGKLVSHFDQNYLINTLLF